MLFTFFTSGLIAAVYAKRNAVCLCESDDNLFTAQREVMRFLRESNVANADTTSTNEEINRQKFTMYTLHVFIYMYS